MIFESSSIGVKNAKVERLSELLSRRMYPRTITLPAIILMTIEETLKKTPEYADTTMTYPHRIIKIYGALVFLCRFENIFFWINEITARHPF